MIHLRAHTVSRYNDLVQVWKDRFIIEPFCDLVEHIV